MPAPPPPKQSITPGSLIPHSSPNYKPGPNAWPGWDAQVINDLGGKVTSDSLWFLDSWQVTEYSNASNNPLNLTAPSGIATINSAGVQSYATQLQGAQHTADLIRNNYPEIYDMLVNDKVKDTLFNSDKLNKLISELNKWGSKSFASSLGKGTSISTDVTNIVKSPFKDITSFFGWVSDNWQRILFFLGGAIAIVIGGLFIFKSQANPGTVAKFAAFA
jgi:hypothetical protein